MDDCIRFVWRKNMAVHSELSGEDTIAAIATGITESDGFDHAQSAQLYDRGYN